VPSFSWRWRPAGSQISAHTAENWAAHAIVFAVGCPLGLVLVCVRVGLLASQWARLSRYRALQSVGGCINRGDHLQHGQVVLADYQIGPKCFDH
jgi:hypothetical protein